MGLVTGISGTDGFRTSGLRNCASALSKYGGGQPEPEILPPLFSQLPKAAHHRAILHCVQLPRTHGNFDAVRLLKSVTQASLMTSVIEDIISILIQVLTLSAETQAIALRVVSRHISIGTCLDYVCSDISMIYPAQNKVAEDILACSNIDSRSLFISKLYQMISLLKHGRRPLSQVACTKSYSPNRASNIVKSRDQSSLHISYQ